MKLRLCSVILLLFIFSASAFGEQKELSMSECVAIAMDNNTGIKISAIEIELSERRKEEITAKLFPQLTASADYRYYTELPYQLLPASVFGGPAGVYKEAQFGVPNVLNSTLQVAMPLYNQSIFVGRKTAAAGAELSNLHAKKTREDVIVEISTVYINAQIAANQLSFLEGNIRNINQLIPAVALLQQNQMAKNSDVDKLKLQKSILEAQQTSAEAAFRQLLGLLKFLMGKPQGDSITIDRQIVHQPAMTDADPKPPTEILITQQYGAILESELDGIYAGRYPSLALYGMYGKNGYAAGGDKSFQKFFPVSFAGVQLTIPLFDGGSIGSKAEQKTLEIRRAGLKEKMAADKNAMDKINIGNQLTVQRKTIAMQEENMKLADALNNQTQLFFKQGMAGITEVLQSESALREAQNNYLTAAARLKIIELEWKKATGSLH